MEREIAIAQDLRPQLLDELVAPLDLRVRALVAWRFDVQLRSRGLSACLHDLARQVLTADEYSGFERFRRKRTARTVSAWLRGQSDRDSAAVSFIVDTVLTAIADSAVREDVARLGSGEFLSALLSRFLEKPP
jgi:hypothetical protein